VIATNAVRQKKMQPINSLVLLETHFLEEEVSGLGLRGDVRVVPESMVFDFILGGEALY
jgi:hypothetical protein